MNPQLSTRYALYAGLEMAEAGVERQVTVGEVAAKYRLPPAALAKVFQRLVRSGLAVGTRGSAGGYRLARPPAEITVLEIIEAFESPRRPGVCLLDSRAPETCDHGPDCRIRHLFDEIDEQARATFASVTLATLVAPRPPLVAAIGRRPAAAITPIRSSPAASK
jgi:Rrf2 family protein